MALVETEYYDLLDVPVDSKGADLKKAYQMAMIKYNLIERESPEAKEKLKKIGKAYRALSDPNQRAAYDRNGKSVANNVTLEAAAGFFANVFEGEKLVAYIGKITLMKEITSVATAMMTDEQKAEVEKQMNVGKLNDLIQGTTSTPHVEPEPTPTATMGDSSGSGENLGQERLEEIEAQGKKAMEERVGILTKQLIERLRPFVEAKPPGDRNSPEILAFEDKMRREAEDMKLESFGTELLHTIGSVYMMKATSFLKSKKFLGMRVPLLGFFSRLKEKRSIAKDAWGVIDSGHVVGVQSLMQEMESLQLRVVVTEETLRAFEETIADRIMLTAWRGARSECVQVLREVCDHVLRDPEVSETVLVNRAEVLNVFKRTQPDESDPERRKLERMAASGKNRLPRALWLAHLLYIIE
ncbi:hypothetical protein BDM02DRAFT_3104345 [Thelephora ganbajun]|uniref:Uncharacterized protein n=1 Tax=Thelephora ganbajun TaxID=370292 RepID=A0ACB6Z2I8_THEGA|nr:hypothetical protein BDM02DRAFT_3104345 [Thelephora ganbajun]